jgi:hypothetical protein
MYKVGSFALLIFMLGAWWFSDEIHKNTSIFAVLLYWFFLSSAVTVIHMIWDNRKMNRQ